MGGAEQYQFSKTGELPLYQKIKEELRAIISSMDPEKNRLETETELARKFKTTRVTIREGMNALINEGLITRWQGKGNFGHPSAANLPMRFDITSDFRKLVGELGKKTTLRHENIERALPSKRMVTRIPEASVSEVIGFDWIYCSGGKPVINCRVEVLDRFFKGEPKKAKGTPKLAEYLETYCDLKITNTTTWLKADTAPPIAELFGLPPETPLLSWEEIFYDLFDRKICFNTIHFHPEKIDPAMLQNI